MHATPLFAREFYRAPPEKQQKTRECVEIPSYPMMLLNSMTKKLFQRRVTPLKSGAQAERSEDLLRRRFFIAKQ